MGQQCLYVVAVMVVVVGEENLYSSEKATFFFFFFLRSDNVQGGCFYKHNGIQDELYDQFKKRSIGMYSTWQRIYQLKCTVGGDGEATFNSGFSHRRRNVPEGGWEGDNYQVPWDNKEATDGNIQPLQRDCIPFWQVEKGYGENEEHVTSVG